MSCFIILAGALACLVSLPIGVGIVIVGIVALFAEVLS